MVDSFSLKYIRTKRFFFLGFHSIIIIRIRTALLIIAHCPARLLMLRLLLIHLIIHLHLWIKLELLSNLSWRVSRLLHLYRILVKLYILWRRVSRLYILWNRVSRLLHLYRILVSRWGRPWRWRATFLLIISTNYLGNDYFIWWFLLW